MTTSRFVIDASVLVARLRKSEPGYNDSVSLINLLNHQKATLLIPTIALAEVAAALTRGTNNPDLANEAVQELINFSNLRAIPIDEELAHLASRIAAKFRLRGCDAIYVGLAWAMKVPLITLDRQQLELAPEALQTQKPDQTIRHVESQ